MITTSRLFQFFLRRMARSQGFLDPMVVFANMARFSKPSEVWVPTELLRSGAVLQARGLMNSQAIQHNRDWVWPYWAQRQFDPTDASFIPRAFNVSHINLTHRNWTAVGLPDLDAFPIVDPRGLLTPNYDGWSLDAWIVRKNGSSLIPPYLKQVSQGLDLQDTLAVLTRSSVEDLQLVSRSDVAMEGGLPVCRLHLEASAQTPAWLVVTARPYNPEGVSFIRDIRRIPEGWKINGKETVHFDVAPSAQFFSDYSVGDVFSRLFSPHKESDGVDCKVGLASAAAWYEIAPNVSREVTVRVPLTPEKDKRTHAAPGSWSASLEGCCRLQIPEKHFQFLYEAALRTLVLHCPGDVYPGPFTYKRFWFRDAAFILNAMLCTGFVDRVERSLDRYPSRQMPGGHFLSQDGEWDSNGQALWILDRFCRVTGRPPKPEWKHAVLRGARWIEKKRRSSSEPSPHAGLLPAGFSAEHLGPNDFYYWDDFWGIAGLQSAASLARAYGDNEAAGEFDKNAAHFMRAVEESLSYARARLGHAAMPASATRRMDAGAIGSITAGYPLQLWPQDDERLLATARFLLRDCFLDGAFYQEISHSGLNAYLTLHVAQVLLRAQDPRFMEPVAAVAAIATSTGQWPEAVHPRTAGGCMGDGQHVWAAAEWVLMMRNLFVREEEEESLLVLCEGIPANWLEKNERLEFGPALTSFGNISIVIECSEALIRVKWQAQWHKKPDRIELRFPGRRSVNVPPDETFYELSRIGA